jgi:membrane-associated phospholipid phosphatase
VGVARADVELFRRVAGLHAPVLDRTLPPLSRLADHAKLWLVIAGTLTCLKSERGRCGALRGLGSLAATSILVNLVLKPLFRRRRPALDAVPAARRLARLPSGASLPSGHAASAFAFAIGAAQELPSLAFALGPLAAAVALSRVYTGVHYPSDVVAGAAVGTTVALLSRLVRPARATAQSA